MTQVFDLFDLDFELDDEFFDTLEESLLVSLTAKHSQTQNVFCPTGPGGGVDPTCSPSGKKASQGLLARLTEPDSGFTYSPKAGEPTTGKVVSPYPERSVAMDAKDLTVDDLLDYMEKNDDLISQDGHFMGGWHNPESGQVFLDTVVVTKTRGEAEKLARDFDQIAYFDLDNFETVTVNPEATSGGVAK